MTSENGLECTRPNEGRSYAKVQALEPSSVLVSTGSRPKHWLGFVLRAH